MSRFERAYCCSAVWRSSSSAIARDLCAQRLGRDVLEISAGSGSIAQQVLSVTSELAWTVPDQFRAECARNGFAISLRSRLLGHVMQFVAHKSKEEI